MDIKSASLNKKFLIIVALISAIKIISVFFINNINTYEDHEIAQNFLKHHSFFYFNDGVINHSFQFPIYPILLSVAYSIYNAKAAAIVLNILLSSISSFMVHAILNQCLSKGWIAFSEKIIIALSLIPLLHPAFVYYELKCVHPFVHDFLFLTIAIYSSISLINSDSSIFEKGMMLGTAVLARGTFIVFPMMLIAYILFRKEIKKASLTLLGMFLMLAPWLTHNYLSDDVLALTSTTGKILWKGSLHDSEGGNYLNNGENYYHALNAADLNTLGQSTVKEQNDFFMQRYLQQWKTEPLHVIKMCMIKLKNFWFLSSNTGTEYPDYIKKTIPLLRLINLIFIGALLFLSFKSREFTWLYIALCFSFLQAVFYVEARHRLLLDPLLLIILIHLLLSLGKKKAFA